MCILNVVRNRSIFWVFLYLQITIEFLLIAIVDITGFKCFHDYIVTFTMFSIFSTTVPDMAYFMVLTGRSSIISCQHLKHFS